MSFLLAQVDWANSKWTQGIHEALLSIWTTFVNWVKDLIGWLFDPSKLLDLGVDLIGKLFQIIGNLFPTEIHDKFNQIGDVLQSAPIQKGWAVGCYFASPILTPVVLSTCVSILLLIWAVSIVIKIIVWIISMVWSNPS